MIMIRLYNTTTRKKEPFIPITPGRVGVYACGPTVYNYAHIGNLRTFVFEDILMRTLRQYGYRTNYVMNITDVGHLTDDGDQGDDKMVLSSRKMNKTVWEVAEFYTNAFLEDAAALMLTSPDTLCKATDHISDMIALIQQLEEKGYTYEAGGNIYFSIDKFPKYGSMAKLDLEQMQAGSRVDVDTHKKNPLDFVLWFTNSKFESQSMVWDSPWGRGYPGWHVECSSMSMKYLGEHFDIHCGGIDAIPVHHTNEIAQSEAATGKKWVNYWLHGEFLIMGDKKKMSKSDGNFITLQSLRDMGYDPLDYRFFLLGAHYRTQLTFSEEALQGAQQARGRLISLVQQLTCPCDGTAPSMLVGDDELSGEAMTLVMSLEEALYDDLHTPRALAVVWQGVKELKDSPSDLLTLLERADRLLGLGIFLAQECEEIPQEISQLVEERRIARENRDYQESDRLRDTIVSAGYSIEDNSDGTTFVKKTNKCVTKC